MSRSQRDDPVVRIAMWSGPRNISTALLRAWENRPDTAVIDEPFYAHYLEQTGLPHPGADEIMRHHETDWRVVRDRLLGWRPPAATIFYQKHMAHHLLPSMRGDWLGELRHAFLIREPREMLLSLTRVIAEPTVDDTGLPQQVELAGRLHRETGETPIVIDARDVLEAPAAMLTTLCDRLGVPFDERMLSWPAGRRPSDGIWAAHWYDQVERSTGFQRYTPRTGSLPEAMAPVLDACRTLHAGLYEQRLTP